MCSVRYAAALALVVVLAAAQALDGAGAPLQDAQAPGGAITGRILDKDGKPRAGAIVQAVAVELQDGREILVPVGQAASNEQGEFRVDGLPAGRYLVSASDPSAGPIVSGDTAPLRYPPTYFPGVVQAVKGERVTVRPGGSARAEFTMQLVRPSRVSGVIRTDDGRRLVSGAVIMTSEENGLLSAVPPEDVTILPDGTFTFRNLPPGRYQIRARGEAESQGVSLFATFSLTVDARDVSNVLLILSPGASVEGRVSVEAGATARPPGYSGMRVRAPFADGTSFGDAPTGDVLPDGSFRIRGVMPGAHYITIEGLPSPWVVQTVTYRGEDLIDVPFDVGRSERLRNLRVTITNLASEVRGTVYTADGDPALGAVVIVLPVSPQFWTRTSRRFRVMRTEADGRFLVRGLPAGEYRAFASVDLDEAEACRPDVLRRVAASGVPLSLADREARTLDLALAAAVASGY